MPAFFFCAHPLSPTQRRDAGRTSWKQGSGFNFRMWGKLGGGPMGEKSFPPSSGSLSWDELKEWSVFHQERGWNPEMFHNIGDLSTLAVSTVVVFSFTQLLQRTSENVTARLVSGCCSCICKDTNTWWLCCLVIVIMVIVLPGSTIASLMWSGGALLVRLELSAWHVLMSLVMPHFTAILSCNVMSTLHSLVLSLIVVSSRFRFG